MVCAISRAQSGPIHVGGPYLIVGRAVGLVPFRGGDHLTCLASDVGTKVDSSCVPSLLDLCSGHHVWAHNVRTIP